MTARHSRGRVAGAGARLAEPGVLLAKQEQVGARSAKRTSPSATSWATGSVPSVDSTIMPPRGSALIGVVRRGVLVLLRRGRPLVTLGARRARCGAAGASGNLIGRAQIATTTTMRGSR